MAPSARLLEHRGQSARAGDDCFDSTSLVEGKGIFGWLDVPQFHELLFKLFQLLENLVFVKVVDRAFGNVVDAHEIHEHIEARAPMNRVISIVAKNGVDAGAAIECVITQPAANAVVAVAARDRVMALSSDDLIVAATGVDTVVPVAPNHDVIANACVDRVVPGSAINAIGSRTGNDRVSGI